jgi:hypothetical protein
MADTRTDLEIFGLREVLVGLAFPAARWQLVMHAQHWGAAPRWVDELIQLPAQQYEDLYDVVRAMRPTRTPVAPLSALAG